LDLESHLRQMARSNQQFGGRSKGSSKLTEADRVDVRGEVARAAGVSVGSLNKAKRILASADPVVLTALMAGDISIHRAWLLLSLTHQEQREAVRRHCETKKMRPLIGRLISQHLQGPTSITASLQDFTEAMLALSPEQQREITVISLRLPSKLVAITTEVAKLLNTQKPMDLE
jgi:hypothetical protein